MLSSDDGLSHSVERENSNEDENESFNNNLFSKCSIQPYMFEPEHEKQDSTADESCFWREQTKYRSSCPEVLCRKDVPETENSHENTCIRVSKVAGF